MNRKKSEFKKELAIKVDDMNINDVISDYGRNYKIYDALKKTWENDNMELIVAIDVMKNTIKEQLIKNKDIQEKDMNTVSLDTHNGVEISLSKTTKENIKYEDILTVNLLKELGATQEQIDNVRKVEKKVRYEFNNNILKEEL